MCGLRELLSPRIMSMHSTRALFGFLLISTSTVSAQTFDYPDFTSIGGLMLNGSAAHASPALRLTPATGGLGGTVFHDTPVAVAAGFDTVFEFIITDPSVTGADGMTFVIHNDPRGATALGDEGTSLAYATDLGPPGTAIVNSLVVELDMWLSGNAGDTSDNEISIHTNGTLENSFDESVSLGRVTPVIDMSNAVAHTFRILYVPGQLDVFLDDLVNPVLSVPYDFLSGGTWAGGGAVGGLSLINGASAYVGFSAATGGVVQVHDLLSWQFTAGGLGTNYCVATANSTAGSAEISAGGSASVAANSLQLRASPVPDQPGIFFYGPNQILAPFGNGFRCVGGVVGRLPVVNANANTMVYQVDNTMPPNGSTVITPGSTWNFQAWFRDPAGGGASFNLSDALELSFLP